MIEIEPITVEMFITHIKPGEYPVETINKLLPNNLTDIYKDFWSMVDKVLKSNQCSLNCYGVEKNLYLEFTIPPSLIVNLEDIKVQLEHAIQEWYKTKTV